jgi:hypothetical protein
MDGWIGQSGSSMWSRIAGMGATDPILALLSSPSAAVQQHAAWAVKGIAAAGCLAIVNIYRTTVPLELIAVCCCCCYYHVSRCCCGSSLATGAESRRVLADKAPHQALVNLLSSPIAEVRKNGALAITALLTDSPANHKLMLEANVIDKLLDLLSDGNNMVQMEATTAFRAVVVSRKGEIMDLDSAIIRRLLALPVQSNATEFQQLIRVKYGDDVMSFITSSSTTSSDDTPTPGDPSASMIDNCLARAFSLDRLAYWRCTDCVTISALHDSCNTSRNTSTIPTQLDPMGPTSTIVLGSECCASIGRVQVCTATDQALECGTGSRSLLGQVCYATPCYNLLISGILNTIAAYECAMCAIEPHIGQTLNCASWFGCRTFCCGTSSPVRAVRLVCTTGLLSWPNAVLSTRSV